MHINHLANELILHIYHSLPTIADAHALSATNSHFRTLFTASQRLPILLSIAETQYGPLAPAIQVLTQNASQPAHQPHTAPISLALLRDLLTLGRVAQTWADLYPSLKWSSDYENRRLLTTHEQYLVRRAVYRLWLYSRAFHNARHGRGSRTQPPVVRRRAALLHNWSTPELAQMADVQGLVRDVVRRWICPSNGTVARRFMKRFPEREGVLCFGVHWNYGPVPTVQQLPMQMQMQEESFRTHFYTAHQSAMAGTAAADRLKWKAEPGAEGWGDDIPHYYVVEDMLKLDPGQILWLKENAPLKGMVEGYVEGLGDWFENNGETFGQTLEWVLDERGEDAEEIREAVLEREMGIVVD